MFHHELSEIPPTLCVIIYKTALKQVLMAFGRALLSQCSDGKKRHFPLSCFVIIFGE